MQVGENQTAVLDPRIRESRQLVPAVLHIHTFQFQSHQQRRGIGDIPVIICLVCTNLAIVEGQRHIHLAPVHVQKRLVPPDMIAKVVAVIPSACVAFDQGNSASGRAVMSYTCATA